MKRTNRRRWALLALGLLPMLVLACGQTYGGGHGSAPPVTATPTLGGIAGSYLEAEEAENQLQAAEDLATVQAAQHQATAAVIQATVNAAASDADAAQEWVNAQGTATAQSISTHATLVFLDSQATAHAAAFAATQTAQARHETATAQAEIDHATATARAEATRATATTVAERATGTAASQFATATTQAEQSTATTEAHHAGQTATVDAHRWGQTTTAEAITATAQARASERERLTHPLRTFGPWVLMITGVIGFGYLTWRLITVFEIRLRALKRDARGDAPIYASGDGRSITLFDPDRNFWAGATIIDGQVIKVYETAPTPSHQARLVAGDQAVDLVTRGSLDGEGRRPFTRRQRTGVARRLLAPPPPQPRGGVPGLRGVRVLRSVGQATSAGVIPPALAGNIEKDWIEGEWTEV